MCITTLLLHLSSLPRTRSTFDNRDEDENTGMPPVHELFVGDENGVPGMSWLVSGAMVDGLAAHCGFVAIVMCTSVARIEAVWHDRSRPWQTARRTGLHAVHVHELDSQLVMSTGLVMPVASVSMLTAPGLVVRAVSAGLRLTSMTVTQSFYLRPIY